VRTEKIKVVYVAGPYSGPDSWSREQNIRAAEDVALNLILCGFAPICVHAVARYWYGRVSEECAIEADLELLHRCDAVVLCAGWEHSRGTLAEIESARVRGIPVYETVGEIMANGTSMGEDRPGDD
jgi:nucleoside 2-deoxyribosyltransferase